MKSKKARWTTITTKQAEDVLDLRLKDIRKSLQTLKERGFDATKRPDPKDINLMLTWSILGLAQRTLKDLEILYVYHKMWIENIEGSPNSYTKQNPKLAKKVSKLAREIQSRKKGLDWVDNLIEHTPDTTPI